MIRTNGQSQCPTSTTITSAGKCIEISWPTPPSPLPSYIIYGGVTFNYSSGTGTSANQAIYRDPSATGNCSAFTGLGGTITLPSGLICGYTGGTLPINWTNVNGTINDKKQAVIYWQVQEINVSKYFIEESKDGISYHEIGIIQSKANGLNNYSFVSPGSLQNLDYYRIKEIDFSGNFSYSSIIRLSALPFSNLTVYPNPVKDIMTINGAAIGSNLVLSDITGKSLQIITVSQTSFTIDMSKFKSGMYIMKTSDGAVQKIFKQ